MCYTTTQSFNIQMGNELAVHYNFLSFQGRTSVQNLKIFVGFISYVLVDMFSPAHSKLLNSTLVLNEGWLCQFRTTARYQIWSEYILNYS